MRKTIQIMALCCAMAPAAVLSAESQDYGRLANIAFASFKCGLYASDAGKKDLVPGLYENGIAAGRKFIEAARLGKVPKEVFQSDVPIFMKLILLERGPSDDFILGRIFDQSISIAADIVDKEVQIGPNPTSEMFAIEPELRKTAALNNYHDGNCWALLKPATQPHQQ